MLITNVKPDLDSIVHFFDYQHHFHTKIDVHFLHNNQQLRASLQFPYHKKGSFLLTDLAVFHHEKWTTKKGNKDQYGLALAENNVVILLGGKISNLEMKAKNQLERRFRHLVDRLAERLNDELQQYHLVDCEITSDYLSIITKFDINGEIIAGKIEANYHFEHTVNDEVFLEELLERVLTANQGHFEKYQSLISESNEEQKVYITTIPLLNPITDESYAGTEMTVAVHSEGYCETCHMTVQSYISSDIHLDLQKLHELKDDFLIMSVGHRFICESCGGLVRKERIVIKDLQQNTILATRLFEQLIHLGDLKNQQQIQQILHEAVEHESFFRQYEEQFWQAFSFVALMKWELFLEELTRKELEIALYGRIDGIPDNLTKEQLVTIIKKLNLTFEEKQKLWREANQKAVHHYLMITIFGWSMKREVAILGQNRAEFMFKFLPIPEKLKAFTYVFESYFSNNHSQELEKFQISTERLQKQIRRLQQENGQLTQKLGDSNSKIKDLEQTIDSYSNDTRSKNDIMKIQQLKGLVDELKDELNRYSSQMEADKKIMELVELSEEHPQNLEEETVYDYPIEEVFKGQTILILGGYRSKKLGREQERDYTLLTHETRNIDPSFYDFLKQADIVVILTRYISHRAMWEAKEHAILAEKPIYFTTFTNIPTILAEVAREEGKS